MQPRVLLSLCAAVGVTGVTGGMTVSGATRQSKEPSSPHLRGATIHRVTADAEPLRALVRRGGIDSLIAGILPMRVGTPSASGKDTAWAEAGDLLYVSPINDHEGLLIAVLFPESGKQHKRRLKPSDVDGDLGTVAQAALDANSGERWAIAALLRADWTNARLQLVTSQKKVAFRARGPQPAELKQLVARMQAMPAVALATFDLSGIVVGNGTAATHLALVGRFGDNRVTVLGIPSGSGVPTTGSPWSTAELDEGSPAEIGLSIPVQFIDSLAQAYLRTRAVPIKGVGRLLAAHAEAAGTGLQVHATALPGSGPEDTVAANFQWDGPDLALKNVTAERIGCAGGDADACGLRSLGYRLAINTLKQFYVSAGTRLRPTKPTPLPVGSDARERTYLLSVANAHISGSRLIFSAFASAPRPREGE